MSSKFGKRKYASAVYCTFACGRVDSALSSRSEGRWFKPHRRLGLESPSPPYRFHAWGTGECAVHRMRTLSRRPRVQTWCARKRTLTSLELGRDGKIQIPKHPSSSAMGLGHFRRNLLPRFLKSEINQYQYQYQCKSSSKMQNVEQNNYFVSWNFIQVTICTRLVSN